MTTDMRATALALAMDRGWHVLPLLPGSKRPYGSCGPCAGRRGGVCPACDTGRCIGRWCHGHYAATAEPEFIGRHWPTGALVGVATEPSGLAVVDVEAAGVPWMREAVTTGLLTPTTSYRSASGKGFHLFYSGVIPGRLRPNGEAIDVKSQGGYVRWTGAVASDLPMVDVPEALVAWLARPVRKEAVSCRAVASAELAGACPTLGDDGRPVHRSPRYIVGAVAMAEKVIREAPKGLGNATVARVLAAFVATHGCCAQPEDYEAVRAAATVRGHDPGSGWEVRFAAHALTPRQLLSNPGGRVRRV